MKGVSNFMPKVDLTITITVVIAICSIVSPVLTAIITNHYQYKIKRLEAKLANEQSTAFYKRGIYEDYLKYAGGCSVNLTESSLRNYGEIYPLAMIYFPSELIPQITQIHELIISKNHRDVGKILEQITPEIHTILQKQ